MARKKSGTLDQELEGLPNPAHFKLGSIESRTAARALLDERRRHEEVFRVVVEYVAGISTRLPL